MGHVLRTPAYDIGYYTKTCGKRPLKNKQTKILMKNGSLMKVKSIAECSSTFDLL